MSDYRAIASVTATLRSTLQDLADVVVPGTRVEAGPPIAHGEDQAEPVIRIFLYSVTPHPTLRNVAQPVRRSDGGYEATPTLPVELHYLISFIGSDPQLKAQLLLGAVMVFLETQPVPCRRDVQAVEAASAAFGSDLAGALAPDEVDQAQFVLEPLDHDALSRLWGAFAQVPYAPSLAYRCALVLLRPAILPQPALPIAEARTSPATAAAPPRITTVEPSAIEGGGAGQLLLRGTGLRGRGIVIAVDGQPVAAVPAVDDTVRMTLPAELAAGTHQVSVAAADGAAASSVAFSVLPRVDGPIRVERHWLGGTHAQVTVDPPCRSGQKVVMMLNEASPPDGRARAVTIAADPFGPSARALQFRLPRLRPGRYLARVEVDGATSRLVRDDDPASATFERYVAPMLTAR